MRTLVLLLAASLTLGGCFRETPTLWLTPDHPQLSGEWQGTLREDRHPGAVVSGPQGLYLALEMNSHQLREVSLERRSPQTGAVLARERISGSVVRSGLSGGSGVWNDALGLRNDTMLLVTHDWSGDNPRLHTLDPLTLRPLRAAVTLLTEEPPQLLVGGEVLRLSEAGSERWLSTRTLARLTPLAPVGTQVSSDGGWWWRPVEPGPGQFEGGELGRRGQNQGFAFSERCVTEVALLGLPPGGGTGERVVLLACGRLYVFDEDGTLLREQQLAQQGSSMFGPQLIALPGGQVGYAFNGIPPTPAGRFDPESGSVSVTPLVPLDVMQGDRLTPWGQVGGARGISWEGQTLRFPAEEVPLRLVTRNTYLDAKTHELSGELFLRRERIPVSGRLELEVTTPNFIGGFVSPFTEPLDGALRVRLELPDGDLHLSRTITTEDEMRRNPFYRAYLFDRGRLFRGEVRR